ncbi:MAG: response regulator [Bdellovibrionales bacterium]|nr:response regulator [Bdellovibrionales bacterium]
MARILVVDDDPDILKIVEKVLSMNHHAVYTASDAMKAMDLLNATTYDLLISDANMPRFSGFELVRTVKNNKRFHRMAICMLTGLREKKDIEKAIRAGVDDYIVKPIDPALLLQKIESILLKKPPMEKAEFNVPEEAKYAVAQVTTTARVTQISELGFVLRSRVEIPDGMAVQIATDLFNKMEMKSPPSMKVIHCKKLVEFDYEISVAFVGVTENFHQKIRAWIFAQGTKKMRGVA